MKCNKRGFTLIELLVVVLIIGILAAVALSQYQKAVMKSRLTQWATYVNSFDKALDAWLLANGGYPADIIYFTGENPASSLDIDMTCNSVSGNYCRTNIGQFVVGCSSSSCWIDFGTNYKNYTGAFPSGDRKGTIWTSKLADGSYGGQRILAYTPADTTFRKIVCEWWATHYGKERMNERAITDCAEVGI